MSTPSPNSSSFPRSKSVPNISASQQLYPNFSDSHFVHPPSNRSSVSDSSAKSSRWKVGTYFGKNELPKHSDRLTELSLEEHNRRLSKSSPYYKGLTDFTLIINREKRFPMSPGRESHATTTVSSSSISTFIYKMQEWSTSCFSPKSKEYLDYNEVVVPSSALLSSRTKENVVKRTSFVAISEVGESDESIVAKEKPLRERVSEPSLAPALARAPAAEPALGTAPLSAISKVVLSEKDTISRREKERQFIWAKKYRPKALNDFICNRVEAIKLQGLLREEECGHFIFEGPPGVGKRTMIRALLQEIFGPDIVQTREECKSFELKGEVVGSIHVNVKISSKHIEVNISELKGYEKHVIVELIKETHYKPTNKALQSNTTDCRAIILYEADKLSTDALLYIRWVLERYVGGNKVFFSCSDVSKLQPIRNICTLIQLFPPSNEEIVEVLEVIAKQEGIELPHELGKRIAENSKNNLRQAIRSFEATLQSNYPFKDDHVIVTGWEDDIANIALDMVEEQSPKQLYIIRGKIQNLIEHDVPPDFIFKTLVVELKKHLHEPLKGQVDNLYDEYNRDNGNIFDSEKTSAFPRNRSEEMGKRLNDPVKKNIQHFMKIEEFIAKFMSCYKHAGRNE